MLQRCTDDGIEVVLAPSHSRSRDAQARRSRPRPHAGRRAHDRGSDILVAAGRMPNTRARLDSVGVELDARGFIKVGERLETSAADVWRWAIALAARSSRMLPSTTSASFARQPETAASARRVIGGAYCMYTDPELGRIGLNESQAQRAASPTRRETTMAAVLRTRTLSETRGFLKAMVATDSDRILGFTRGRRRRRTDRRGADRELAGTPYTGLRDAILTQPDDRRRHDRTVRHRSGFAGTGQLILREHGDGGS